MSTEVDHLLARHNAETLRHETSFSILRSSTVAEQYATRCSTRITEQNRLHLLTSDGLPCVCGKVRWHAAWEQTERAR